MLELFQNFRWIKIPLKQRRPDICLLDDVKIIRVEGVVAHNLGLRHSVDKLFDCIDSLKNINVVIDFQGVYMTNRSFMHQFLHS
jgi:hypothetical protein